MLDRMIESRVKWIGDYQGPRCGQSGVFQCCKVAFRDLSRVSPRTVRLPAKVTKDETSDAKQDQLRRVKLLVLYRL